MLQLQEDLQLRISDINPLPGGSINDVFLLQTSDGERVVKCNSPTKFPGMFPAEKIGLDTLRSADAFEVPQVYACVVSQNKAYLLMEYIKPDAPGKNFWEDFGHKLSKLHRTSASSFGFPTDNYIGSLPQYNASSPTLSDFYIAQRLLPQFRLASEKGFVFPLLNDKLKRMEQELPNEAPALLHGDLWHGNYLVNHQGLPVLIDPAVCYGPREMDLAMMKLFGGYPEEVFQIYQEEFPVQHGWEKRVAIWQLYYLLVHLNIFGKSYFSQVDEILRRFS